VRGDREKVRALLAQWGVAEPSIRRLMREETPAEARGAALTQGPARVVPPRGRDH
jgi:hypothetical protein